jgi:hypothetical protein
MQARKARRMKITVSLPSKSTMFFTDRISSTTGTENQAKNARKRPEKNFPKLWIFEDLGVD